ncbi:MAG: hypothetical protein ABSE76_02605 [Minisyncoccia bacterium]
MIANILDIFNMLPAKQNQKFPFHFLSAPPTPPAENLKLRKENFWVLPARVRERGRGALVRITTQSERTRQFQATTHAERAKSVRVLLEMGSNFFKQTPPKLISIRIDRARASGAGLGWHFRQEIPRGFEFRRKHSRRYAAVQQANACSVLRTGADVERLQIVGVSAMPLSI